MARTIPSVEPTRFRAGLSVEWDRSLSNYPPSAGWSLVYSLSGAHTSVLTVTAATASDGDYFQVRIPKTATALYTPGRYDLIGEVDDGTDRFEVYRAALVVDPSSTATPRLSQNERMLALLDARIEERLSADIASYTAEGQEVHREELAILQKQRNMYAEAVRRERRGGGGGGLQSVKARFVSPS